MNTPNQIPLTSFTDYVCENKKAMELIGGKLGNQLCNSREFVPVVRLKTYKGLMSGGQQVVAQIQVFQCVACGAIHNMGVGS